jgi:hypothetical protein
MAPQTGEELRRCFVIQRRKGGGDHIGNVNERQTSAIPSNGRQPAPAHQCDHFLRRRIARTVKEAVTKHDAFDRSLARRFQNLRFHRSHRLCRTVHLAA